MNNKTYSNGVIRIQKGADNAQTVRTITETKFKTFSQIERNAIALLQELVKMFPERARQFVRMLDIPE